MNADLFRKALILGLITAIGPLAIDMYLPSLPALGRGLNADPDLVLLSLTAFFIPFGACQLIYGTASDILGRKAPLYFGVGLFVLASLGCALSTDVTMLIVFRFFQGMGAAAGISIPGAIVRDMHTGVEAARLMSLLMLVFSVSPILAPLGGSLLIEAFGWRSVFWAIMAGGLAALLLLVFALRETRPPSARSRTNIAGVLASYRSLLGDRTYVGQTFIGAFGLAGFFVYLGNSPFILIEQFGLTPIQFGLAFSANALSFFGTAQLNGWLGQRFGLERLLMPAATGFLVVMASLYGLTVMGMDRLDVLCVFLVTGYAFLGVIIPVSTVLAMENHGGNAGAAFSLVGTLRMVTGSLIMAGSGYFMNGTIGPMVGGIALCAGIVWLMTLATMGWGAKPAPAE